nr:substrate-binding domain-containing protein [Cohnella zeiphila]
MDGLQDRLQELGHSVSTSFLSSRITGRGELEDWIANSDLLYADGVVIPPAIPDEIESLLLDIPLPKVLINYPPPLAHVDSVIWDVEQAIHQSVRHFVSMGHKRILYIGDTDTFRGFRLRWSAFCAAMRGAGLTVDPEEHLTSPAQSSSEWERQLTERLLESDRTAILCAVDSYLNPLIYFLQARGKSIPNDYSLIGLENMASPLFPHISRPSLLVREAGRKAAERLLWRIANPDEPFEHIRLSGGFLEGNSVRRLV